MPAMCHAATGAPCEECAPLLTQRSFEPGAALQRLIARAEA